jgi:hypothetical protein
MSQKSKGLTKFILAKDGQLLPAPDAPIEKPKGPAKEDPLKACVRGLLDQGGRDEIEAEKWCRDYLDMRSEFDESTAIDSANVKEAERILIQTREDIMKPRELEQCTRNRMAMLGEGEFTAGQRCLRDWDLNEKIRGTAIMTDSTESRLRILDPPEAFKKLERLRVALDHRTTELVETFNMLGSDSGCAPRHYTAREADRKARTELGLPQVWKSEPMPEASMPDAFNKTAAQRIQEQAADTDITRRPGERLISPHSGVPRIFGKTRAQILEETYEADAEGKKNR